MLGQLGVNIISAATELPRYMSLKWSKVVDQTENRTMHVVFIPQGPGHDLSELGTWIRNESCLACICVVDGKIDEFTTMYRELASYMSGFCLFK